MSDTTTLSLERYRPDAKALVAGAQALADELKHVEVSPLHLLVRALDRDPGVIEVFRRAGAQPRELLAQAERALSEQRQGSEPAFLSAKLLDLLERAERERQRDKAAEVGVEQLLNAMAQEIRGPAGELLAAVGIRPGSLRAHTSALESVPRPVLKPVVESGSFTRDLVELARAGALDPMIGRDAELRRLVTVLERRGKQHPLLIGEAGTGKSALVRGLAARIGRGDVPTSLADVRLLELSASQLTAGVRLRGELEERVRRLIGSLKDERGNNVLVVRHLDALVAQGAGGSGVGELLSAALQRGELRMLATTTPEGQRRLAEKDSAVLRLFTPIEVAEPSAEQSIEVLRGLAIKYEEHHAVQISEGAIVAAVSLAKRYLQDRFLPDSAIDLLDEAAASYRVEQDGLPRGTDEALRRLESLDAQLRGLDRADDPASRDAIAALTKERAELAPKVAELTSRAASRRGAVAAVRAIDQELTVALREQATAQAERQFARLGELEHVTIPALRARLEAAEAAVRALGASSASEPLTEAGVARTLAEWTGIPVAKMLEEEAEKLLKMEARLEARIVGQDDAVRAVARAVRRGRVGLRDPGKPIGSFLMLGPSGVGKTELAKALAEFLFDDEAALTRLDMSEFAERHMAQRLIGAPPGYADSEQGGFLTESVRRRPYSVLLFDEVEKAHQDVFNLLLQVLDDGRLTDGRGRLADFSNTVVILTSNIGSQQILESDAVLFESDAGREALRDLLLARLGEFFRPEFLNRIDDVVVFRPLLREHLRRIIDIQLGRLGRLLAERRLTLELDDAAKDRLVELGYEPALGARPLKRAVLREIQDPLAEAILSGRFQAGARIRVRFTEGRFLFEV
ncbi:MAG: AAA family ATPase [Polyangiaceae bacterium]|nr:AAA family ATPase [Polyangiaceae bacterium]MCW5792383.1 AAA family ATPase [Polyangiaceae bacterium]